MPNQLDHRVKLDRANEHLNALQDAIKAFIESEPYRTITKFDRQTGEHVVQLKSTPVPPARLSVMVGDVLFNLRSSLDHIVFAAAMRAGRTPAGSSWTEGNGVTSCRSQALATTPR